MTQRQILIIAGPNGAGKTTFAKTYLRVETQGMPFLNADEIASGLDLLDVRLSDAQAARLILAEIDGLVSSGSSFAFETTLSGRGYLRRIDQWQRAGYRVGLIFLSLSSPDEAVARVRRRVQQGGHHIPEAVIRRRFDSGLVNFREHYAERVDKWMLLDNTQKPPIIIDKRVQS